MADWKGEIAMHKCKVSSEDISILQVVALSLDTTPVPLLLLCPRGHVNAQTVLSVGKERPVSIV
jgi:hypothetical protein